MPLQINTINKDITKATLEYLYSIGYQRKHSDLDYSEYNFLILYEDGLIGGHDIYMYDFGPLVGLHQIKPWDLVIGQYKISFGNNHIKFRDIRVSYSVLKEIYNQFINLSYDTLAVYVPNDKISSAVQDYLNELGYYTMDRREILNQCKYLLINFDYLGCYSGISSFHNNDYISISEDIYKIVPLNRIPKVKIYKIQEHIVKITPRKITVGCTTFNKDEIEMIYKRIS